MPNHIISTELPIIIIITTFQNAKEIRNPFENVTIIWNFQHLLDDTFITNQGTGPRFNIR